MAKVTLVLGEETLENNIALAIEHQNDADLFEVRADFLRQEELANLPSLALKLPKPAILTFRLPKDGGVWRSSEKQRQQAFLLALEGSWYAIDIEEFIEAPTIIQKAREKGIKIVRSFHNFEGIPKDTGKRMKDIAESGFIPKAAVTCRNSQDFARWVRIAEEIQELKVKVLLGMGDFGLPTRLLAGLWGMSWTYGSSEGQTMAPGQITVSAMTQIFRVQAVNSKTTVYGIIGNPVLHSKSPHFHNMALAHLGLDALYLPFPVSDPKNFWPLLGALNIKGLSVTIPWKGDAALWAQGQTPRVQKIGACNTLYIQKNRWMGDNTDAPGFFEPIAERLGPESLAGKKACVIGNGGASKAAIYALLEAGVEVLVLGRNLERVKKVIKAFEGAGKNIQAGLLAESSKPLIQIFSDIIIQTTPLGMGEKEGVNPLAFYQFKGTELLYDMVYVPEKTAFIQEGIKAGCSWISGKSMLFHQGFRQFELFTGKSYPESLKSQFIKKD